MKNPTFMIPHLRGAGFLVDVHHDPVVGSIPSEHELDTMDALLTGWSGLLRAVTLAGYRAVELFVEVDPNSATQRLVLDLATLGLGSAPVTADGLGDVRADAPALLVAIAVDPLWPFGEPTGVPLALALPTTAMEAVDGVYAPVSQEARGWIGFTSDEGDVAAARDGLVRQGLDVAEILAATVSESWALEPDGHVPSGLGWLFDDRTWWFPPNSPDQPDPAGRVLHDTLADVAEPLRTGDIDVPAFVAEQVVRKHNPRLLSPGGSFAQLTRTFSGQSPDVAVEAYTQRVATLVLPGSASLQEFGTVLARRFTWTDAVLTMIEHGAVGAAHRLLPGNPSTSLGPALQVSMPEWTTPQLTGQWDLDPSVGFDTLLLNQAGTIISGFWQQHHPTFLERFVISGVQSEGDRDGGPLTFAILCRLQGDTGPGLDSPGELTVEVDASGEPLLTLVVNFDTETTPMLFAPTKSGLGGAHPTERSMTGLPEHAKERIRTLRDAPLHHTELVAAVELLRIALVHIHRYLDERPDWDGLRILIADFKTMVDTEFAVFPVFLQNEELLATAAFYIKSELATLQPLGSLSALSTLLQMFSLTHVQQPSLELQRIYDLEVQPGGFGNFRYQWRLVDIDMRGLVLGVGGAVGTGTFELQRVDADGNAMPPVISRDIDLYAVQGGTDIQLDTYEGPGDFDDWNSLSLCGRDIVPALDGAVLSLIGFGGGFAVVVESTGTIDVTLSPNDDLPPLFGRIDPALVEVPILAAPDEIDPADAYERTEQVNELKDIVKEAIEKGYEKYVEKGLKKGIKTGAKKLVKSIPVDFNGFTLDGWIRTADGQPTRPDPAPIPVSEYAGNDDNWARFEFDEYELTDEFRSAIRQFLLENLPLLTGAGEVVIEGHASRLAREESYNVRLSRDRAGSVLLAMYDILGPQIGIPWGDLRVVGLGSSQSTGDPDSDLALDRRVDVTIAGSIRMSS